MKRITLALLVLVSLSTIATAQAVDPSLQAAVNAAVPPQYAGYTALGLFVLMAIGRWIKALQNGTGIKGWLSAIWMGTNTPRLLIASLCLLSLPSCADTTDPAEIAKRQRIVGLSQRGLDLLVKHQMMTKEDAALAQELGTLVINPPPPAKQPVNVQP